MITALVAAIIISLGSNALVRSLAISRGWVSAPVSDRHIHEKAIPRLGGIGIFVAFLVTIVLEIILRPSIRHELNATKLLLPATLMFGVGILDDLRPLSARVKLTCQIIAGFGLYGWIKLTPFGAHLLTLEYGVPLLAFGTVAWVVLVSNSINLIDGVDGLAAGTATLSLASVLCIALQTGHRDVALVSAVLIGAILGFLPFNLNPARMFLGDGGSLFLGFIVSAVTAGLGKSGAIAGNVAVAVAITALPLAETGVSVTRRFLSGRPIFAPDREHMHHKLLDRGFSQRTVVGVLYGVAAVCGLAGISISWRGGQGMWASVLVLLLVFFVGFTTLGYVEFRELGRIVQRLAEQRRVVANDVVIRKISSRIRATPCIGTLAEDLRDALLLGQFDGFELVIDDAVKLQSPCLLRSEATTWGFRHGRREIESTCWDMTVDLTSPSGKQLGRLQLARKVARGSLLLDVNLLISELQPALVYALQHCLSCCGETTGARRKEFACASNPIVTIQQSALKPSLNGRSAYHVQSSATVPTAYRD